jgi:hypothetical protein
VGLAADNPLNTHPVHQPGNRAAGDVEALAAQLSPDFPQAVELAVCIKDTLDVGPKLLMPPGTIRQTGRVNSPLQVLIIGRRSARQNLADRLGPMLVPVIVDEAINSCMGVRAPPSQKTRWPYAVSG